MTCKNCTCDGVQILEKVPEVIQHCIGEGNMDLDDGCMASNISPQCVPMSEEAERDYFKDKKQVSEDSVEAALFKIIDDIDTGLDMFKPDSSPYLRFVEKKIREAHNHIASDGYKLYYVKDPDED